jgi:hypothetical protein
MNKLTEYLVENITPSANMLLEGGAAGHMAHPFDFSHTGKNLIDVFKKSIESLKAGTGAMKIDGLNVSIRLVNGKFVMDRGSAKPADVKGMRPEDLPLRFTTGIHGLEHGLVGVGTKVITIFDESYNTIKPELDKLGLLKNQHILLNIEYVEGKSNVISYTSIGNFLAVHGLNEIFVKTVTKDGQPKSRASREIGYNKNTMSTLIHKVNLVAQKHHFKVLGSIATEFKHEPNLNKILAEKQSVVLSNGTITKTLLDWLKDVKIPHPMITKLEFQKVFGHVPVDTLFDKTVLKEKIYGGITYLATIKLGDEILHNLTSEIGDANTQEGIVIRDPKIYANPFKITGSFIIKAMDSKFNK